MKMEMTPLAVSLLALSLTVARANENEEWQKAEKLFPEDVCLEAGRVLHLTQGNAATESWANVVLERARTELALGPQDYGHVRERRLRMGMHTCAVLAALGRPNDVSATMTARGTSHLLAYAKGRIRYVLLHDERVVGWHE
jgi:hypothetical protein